jgi:hypothetical protein
LGERQIDLTPTGSNGVLFGQADAMFEIRNDQDIVINVTTLSFDF